MTSPERSQYEQLKPLEQGRWEELKEHFRSKASIAEHLGLGIKVSYILRDAAAAGRHTIEKNADEPVYSASLMKLGVAGAIVEARLSPWERAEWPEDRRDTTGSGVYDHSTAPTEASIGSLIEDMLAYSGNTAVRVLAPRLGGAKGINAYLAQHYDETSVIDAGNQAIIFGQTTPHEALRMLRKLYDDPETDAGYLMRAALRHNRVTSSGVRRNLRTTQSRLFDIANKPANYPGDDPNNKEDPYPIPYSVAHDVGFVQNTRGQRLEYAILTRAPRYDNGSLRGKVAHQFAERTVSQMGAEIAYTLLGKGVVTLGARAVHLA